MYFYVTKYKATLPKIGGNGPKTMTRLDQPAIAVHPFNDLDSVLYDGDNSEIKASDDQNVKAYLNEMESFLNKYDNKNAVDCESNSVETNTCIVANVNAISTTSIKAALNDKQPIVFLTVNKVFDWRPLNSQLGVSGVKNFTRDAIYFDCYESDIAVFLGVKYSFDQIFDIFFKNLNPISMKSRKSIKFSNHLFRF